MELIETIKYKKHEINICQDDINTIDNPRDWDNFGTMVCFHNDYNLGDEHNFDNSSELLEYIKNTNIIYLPLYLYDHGGITISTKPFSCRWDSGQVGIIYVDQEKIRKEYGKKRISKKLKKQILNTLESETEAYNQYLTGDVYGYQIEGELCEDSCWGFYGDPEQSGLLTEAKSSIDYAIKQDQIINGVQLELNLKG